MDLKLKGDNSLLERLGVKYFERLDFSLQAESRILLDGIPSDRVLEAISRVIVRSSTIIAFLLGAIVTVPLVVFEIVYYEKISAFDYFLQYGAMAFISLLIEFLLLYWLTFHSVYALLHLIGNYPQKDDSLPDVYLIDRVLIRSALELEEPILEYIGINPRKKISKTELFIFILFYKLKVIISGFIFKKVLKAVLPRVGARTIFIPMVGVFVVAFWDAYVINRSIKDAKLRLFGYYFSKFLVDEVLLKKIYDKNSSIDIEGLIRAIGSIVVSSKSNHPNNLILLVRLGKHLEKIEIENPDSIKTYLEYLDRLSDRDRHYLRVLSTISAVLDAKLTRDEREELIRVYGDERSYYFKLLKKMKRLLINGHIHQLSNLVLREFEISIKREER
jgi:hypothetical protein